MLSLMRRHAKSWFIKFALGAIAIVFIFWGVGSYTSRQGARVALVNNQIITAAELNEAYHQLVEEARRRFGDALDAELIKKLDLRTQALNRLITRQLILQAAEKTGVVIGDEIVLAAIRSDPAFQENGQFSPRLYQRLLQLNRLQPAAFEAQKRQDLTIGRMESRLALLNQASQAELTHFFRWFRDEIKISAVVFDPADFEAAVSPNEAAITAYFKQNQEAYRLPEKIKVDYLAFRTEDFKKEVSISPEQVEEYYEVAQESFVRPEQVRLSHILISIPPQASQEEIAQKKQEAEQALAKLRQGADFAAVAAEASEGLEAERGGELGWLSRDQLNPELAEAAFQLKPGEVSEVIQTRFGFHILKVEEKQPARVLPLESVRAEIEEKLKTEEAKDKALDEAERAYGLSAGVSSLDELAKAVGQKKATVGPYSRQDPPQGPAADPRFSDAAFASEVGEVAPAVELDDGYYLLMVTEKKPSYLPDLAEVADQVKKDYILAEAKNMAKAKAEAFLKEAKTGEWLELAKKAGLEVKSPPAFTRQSAIEGLGYNLALNQAAFELSATKPLPDQVYEADGKFVVIHFEERLPASPEALEKEKDQISQMVQSQRLAEFSQAWLEGLRQQAKISIEKSQF